MAGPGRTYRAFPKRCSAYCAGGNEAERKKHALLLSGVLQDADTIHNGHPACRAAVVCITERCDNFENRGDRDGDRQRSSMYICARVFASSRRGEGRRGKREGKRDGCKHRWRGHCDLGLRPCTPVGPFSREQRWKIMRKYFSIRRRLDFLGCCCCSRTHATRRTHTPTGHH